MTCIILAIFSIYLFGVEAQNFACYGSGNAAYWGESYSCPSGSAQCFKYVCTGSPQNPFYILKGCLNSATTSTLTCTTMNNACLGQGGNGTCYTCSTNLCNDASSLMMNKNLFGLIPILYLGYKTYF
uniref:Uncharacterized protein n=1 Tax=Acrobeloides nanus TaxID=290746 RepID=A0A914E378_9BILA